jgi:NAD(P)-dependent dehydrogenase (short-subunit alcohol dehydrogenase family)
MDLGLNGKTALITGASRGIGAATATLLAAEGVDLALVARDGERLDAQAAKLRRAHGVRVTPIAIDLTEPAAAPTAYRTAMQALGSLDLLVNSVGASQGGRFWDLDDAVWEASFQLKFMGTVRMMRAVVPDMVARRSGRIVTIIGNAGKQPSARQLPGAAANAALLAITKGLADDVAPYGVIVNAVNPGPTRTDRLTTLMANQAAQTGRRIDEIEADLVAQIPLGRLGEPDEMARLVVFLCSPAAMQVTGTSLTADGGTTRALA